MGNNALSVYEKVVDPLKFSLDMAKSTAALCGCSLDQGAAIMLHCLCAGITPYDFKRSFHIIKGQPSMRSDAMLAEFRKAGGEHEIVEDSSERAAIKLTEGKRKPYENEFTWEQAKDSRWPWKDADDHSKGLKDNWSTPTDRKAMLWARLVSESIRRYKPEIVAGIYTPEEIRDSDDIIEGKVVKAAPLMMTAQEVVKAHMPQIEASLPTEAATNGQERPEEEAAAVDDTTPLGTGYVTRAQIDHLLALSDELDAPLEMLIKKRGVNAVRSLTKEQGEELIDKLEARKRQVAESLKN